MKRHNGTEHQDSSLSTSCLEEVPCDQLPHTTTVDCTLSNRGTQEAVPSSRCSSGICRRVHYVKDHKHFQCKVILMCDELIRLLRRNMLGTLSWPTEVPSVHHLCAFQGQIPQACCGCF